VQGLIVDVKDVDPKADFGGQVDGSVAAGCRRQEPIMISELVPLVEYPVEDTNRMPGRCELIMDWPTDKTGAAGEQYLHAEWLAG
jgi:hypothetical protein